MFFDFSLYGSSDDDKEEIPIVMPRRNSIDISKESEEPEKKFENQVSDYKHRRHTDNMMHRRNLSAAKNEFTTQKIRQEWAEHEQEQLLSSSQVLASRGNASSANLEDTTPAGSAKDTAQEVPKPEPEHKPRIIVAPQTEEPISSLDKCDRIDGNKALPKSSSAPTAVGDQVDSKDESKSKKRRRRKSVLKRKSVSSISMGPPRTTTTTGNADSIARNETAPELTKSMTSSTDSNDSVTVALPKDDSSATPTPSIDAKGEAMQIKDYHFFSDTEMGANKTPSGSRPSSPIKSDSELEISHCWNSKTDDIMNTSASWKWGELPTPAPIEGVNDPVSDDVKQARRISMISNVFSFMKQSKKMRKTSQEGIYLSDLEGEDVDPEMEALYLPPMPSLNPLDAEDHESGNGTSLPHSPSSLGSPKSMDSDYEEGKYEEAKVSSR